jgi:hypothetical protein
MHTNIKLKSSFAKPDCIQDPAAHLIHVQDLLHDLAGSIQDSILGNALHHVAVRKRDFLC